MRFFGPVLGVLLGFLAWTQGCQSIRPASPSRILSLTVSIPSSHELRASLLGSASNEVLYRVDGPGMAPVKGKVGPFSSAASSGSIDFSVEIPTGPSRILAVQLNDGSSHQPLAIGATNLDLTGPVPASGVVVDMGSVTRNCYFVDESRTTTYSSGSSYGFTSDLLANNAAGYFFGPAYDIACNCPLGPFYFQEAQNAVPTANMIGYLGKGDFVDYARVPAHFYPDSQQAKGGAVSVLETGDIYCIKLATMPGYAWVQVTDPGTMYVTGPSFRFRVNQLLNYYAYDQTQADLGALCNTGY